ncbi:MAG TPA: dihydroorotase [Nevskiaceae bacterium]|nr:dihydroorotase [Nevskiaceae bacterium]
MLITNARIVNEGRLIEGDLRVHQGRIEQVGGALSARPGEAVTDAAGRLLMPGMIDDQVHFREPGLTHKGNLATESAAAVAGGITSFMDMPNNQPTITTRERLAEKYAMAEGRCHGNYAFYFGGANDNLAEIQRLQPDEACALKVFMGASTGNMLVDHPEVLDAIFRDCPLMVVTHCEDTPMILANEAAARERYGDEVPFSQHPLIRSREACWKSTELATGLARKHGSRLHVLHLTTAEELSFFQAGPLAGKRITVEACVHHLALNDSLYAERGAAIKCNPAVKTEADRQALVRAVMADVIDVVATDHAPHTLEEKARPYFKAPSGLPLVQHALLMLFGLVAKGELDLHTLVRKVCHAPAELFGVRERGYLREGYWADLVLVDDRVQTTVTRESVLYHCGWSPLEGFTYPARIDATWVNGELAWDGQKVLAPRGQRLRFDPRR